jgi:hypothetical protein
VKAVGELDRPNDTAEADNVEKSRNCWDQTSFTAHRFANRIESRKHRDGCDHPDEPSSRPRAENSNDSAEGKGSAKDSLKKRLSVQKEK